MERPSFVLDRQVLPRLRGPHPARDPRALLEGERSVGEIAGMVAGTVATVSTHLPAWRGCGLLASEKRGTYVYYRLRARQIKDVFRLDRGARADVSRPLYE